MLARKDTVVKQNNDGILYLFKKNKVAFFHGRGSFVEGGRRRLRDRGRRREAARRSTGKHVIVATGSNAARAARRRRSTRRTILSQRRRAARSPAVPKKLGVIGAGVIGLEMGSVWRRLGAEVTVLEALPDLPRRRRRADRQGSAEGLRQAGPEDRARRQDRRGQDRQEGRRRRLHRRQGRGADARRATS